jgi:CBS domain-containing protein
VYRGATTDAAADAYSIDTPKTKGGWGETKVFDLLQQKPGNQGAWLWCSKDDFVIDAVKKMTKANVGSLLVFDPSKLNPSQKELKSVSGDAVVGIVTERDYLTKVVVQGKSSATLPVANIMTPESKLCTVNLHQSVAEVLTIMLDNNIRHVPVVQEGNYLGMLSIRDAVSVMVQEHREDVKNLHEYIQGSY